MSETLEGELIDSESEEESTELVLVFTAEGQVELEEDDEMMWSSDDDDDFQVKFGNEFLEPDQDARDILNWLVEQGLLDEEEKSNVEIEVEEDDGDSSEIEAD